MHPVEKKLFNEKYGHLQESDDSQPYRPNSRESIENQSNNNNTYGAAGYNKAPTPTNPNLAEILQKLETSNTPKLGLRVTTDYFPATKKVHKSSSIPLGAIIQPYASIYSYPDFPTINFGLNHSIVRCDDCRAYVNPFSKFIEYGSKFQCNICGNINKVPSYYHSQLNINGEREDKNSRVELSTGLYDIKAGTDYMTRPPVPPVYLFVIDVTQKSVQSGMLDIFVSVLKDIINNDIFIGGPRTTIGFITYDSSIHVYTLNPALKSAQMIVLSDLEELLLPVPEDILANLMESKSVIQGLLNSIPSMFENTTNNGSCLTQSLELATKILKNFGGRIYIMQSSNALQSEKKLSAKVQNNDKSALLMPSNQQFSNMTAEMQHHFISVDMFIYSDTYKNIITLGELARYLNGDIHYYIDEPERAHKFYYEFKNSLLREYTWETVFRVRISSGWKATQIYGNFSITSSDLLTLPNIDDSKAITYEFTLNDEIARSDVFYLQTALLYTNIYGERRIRVMNYGIPLTHLHQKIIEKADSQAIGFLILRQALANLYKNGKITEVRNEIMSKTKDIIIEAMNQKAQVEGQSQLIDSIATLPMISLGILKHPLFSSTNIDSTKELDIRNTLRIKLGMLNLEETMLHFVPYLFAAHSMAEENTSYYDETGLFIFPQLLGLSFNNLSNDGVYVMDDGQSLFMMVGSRLNQTKLTNLFGIKSLNDIQQLSEDFMYHNSKDELVTRMYNLLTELRSRKFDKYAYLYVIKEGEKSKAEMQFYSKLIEDKMNIPNTYAISYNEFLDLLLKARQTT